MLLSPLIPVPTPTPTTERIVVEVQNAAGSGWTAPVLAALLAGALAHVLTRKRDHSAWFRERLFDSTSKLNTHGRALLVEGTTLAQVAPGMSLQQLRESEAVQRRHDIASLETASRGYNEAINELQLLLRTEPFPELLFDAWGSVFSAYQVLIDEPTPAEILEAEISGVERVGGTQRIGKFRHAHNTLMNAITREYFLPDGGRKKGWWWRTPIDALGRRWN